MRASAIRDLTDRVVPLSPAFWAAAQLLGRARTLSNDGTRHRTSDRGAWNAQVDLLGALGELYLLRECTAASDSTEGVAFMREHLFNPDGGRGVDGPDLRFVCDDDALPFSVDVKTFDCSANKRLFAINNNKHKALAGHCTAYFCLITPAWGRQMAISRLVPHEDVQGWDVRSLGRYGSPSSNLGIDLFLGRYFTRAPDIIALREARFQEAEVLLAMRADNVRRRLVTLIPALAEIMPRLA